MRFSGEFAEFESSHSEKSKESSKGGSFGFSGHGGLFSVSEPCFLIFMAVFDMIISSEKPKHVHKESVNYDRK